MARAIELKPHRGLRAARRRPPPRAIANRQRTTSYHGIRVCVRAYTYPELSFTLQPYSTRADGAQVRRAQLLRERPQCLGTLVIVEKRMVLREAAVGVESALQRAVRREAAGERRAAALVHALRKEGENALHESLAHGRIARDAGAHHRPRVQRDGVDAVGLELGGDRSGHHRIAKLGGAVRLHTAQIAPAFRSRGENRQSKYFSCLENCPFT